MSLVSRVSLVSLAMASVPGVLHCIWFAIRQRTFVILQKAHIIQILQFLFLITFIRRQSRSFHEVHTALEVRRVGKLVEGCHSFDLMRSVHYLNITSKGLRVA